MGANSALGIPLQKFIKSARKMSFEELHDELKGIFKIHQECHEKFINSANKKSGKKARSALWVIRHIIPIYNRKSLEVLNKTRFEMTFDTEVYLKKHKYKNNGI